MNAGSALDYFVQSSPNWGEQTRDYAAFFLFFAFFLRLHVQARVFC